jgi:hypothetical protein
LAVIFGEGQYHGVQRISEVLRGSFTCQRLRELNLVGGQIRGFNANRRIFVAMEETQQFFSLRYAPVPPDQVN